MSKLDELVESYGNHDAQLKPLKKLMDAEKEELKTELAAIEKTEHSFGGFTVSISESTSVKTNEPMMLQVLKEHWKTQYGDSDCPYVKTVEVVDTDAVELALYNGDFDDDLLSKLQECQTESITTRLYCKKTKKGTSK